MESTYKNVLLKIACALMVVFTLASMVITVANASKSLSQVQSISDSDRLMLQDSIKQQGGGVTVEQATGLAVAMVYLVIGFTVVGGIPRIIAGILGFSRADKPVKHKYFTIWGTILLVLGAMGLIISGVKTLPAAFDLISGIAAPILFLVGAGKNKKALLSAGQPMQQ